MALEIRSPQTTQEWENYYFLRYEILRKPLGQPEGSEKNDGDKDGIHIALFEDGIIRAIARLDVSEPKIAQVRFVATDSSSRKKGFGKMIMLEAERISKERGDKKLILQARENAVDFYLSLGYKMIKKTHLLFGQVQHFLMEKEF